MERSRANCYALAVLLYLLLAPLVAAIAVNAALYALRWRVGRASVVCEEDEEEALPSSALAAAFTSECAALLGAALLCLLGPLTSRRLGDAAAGHRVVLLHGLWQTRGAMLLLGGRLAESGFGVVFFSHAYPRDDVPAAAQKLRRLLVDLQAERQGPVHLLGFGLGGLVARYCVRRHPVPGVRRVLTLGTAHGGTRLAPPWPAFLAQLRPESPLLAQLAAADRAPEQFESTAIQSELDATVLPPENGDYPAAFNVVVRDTGHFSLLFSRRIFQLVAENLGES